MRVYLIETVREEFTPDTVYWAFDWDDNILTMPTQIVLLDDKGEEVLMSTEDFAEHRHQIGVEPFKYTLYWTTTADICQYGSKNDYWFVVEK